MCWEGNKNVFEREIISYRDSFLVKKKCFDFSIIKVLDFLKNESLVFKLRAYFTFDVKYHILPFSEKEYIAFAVKKPLIKIPNNG